MAVNFKLYQNNREGFKNQGKWYARAFHPGEVGIDQLADIMQANCTVKRSDIVAVISELVETMTTQLQNSMVVRLERFGSFKISLSSSGADTPDSFNVSKNIRGMRVNFLPEYKIDAAGNRKSAFIDGVKVKKIALYSEGESAGTSDSTDGDEDRI